MARWRKLRTAEFQKIKNHWDPWTKDGQEFVHTKDKKGLEAILKHCQYYHGVPNLLASQKDKLLERLIRSDIEPEIKRQE